MSAIQVWQQRVAAHHAQSQKIRAALGIAEVDRWEVVSPLFKANPRRTDDVEVNRLVREVSPSTTVLDVGGGAGRFALPLALHCQHVMVVEPSPSMGESLRHFCLFLTGMRDDGGDPERQGPDDHRASYRAHSQLPSLWGIIATHPSRRHTPPERSSAVG
jgi:hypothetical protein